MRKLDKPSEDVAMVFKTCISTVMDPARRHKLELCSAAIVKASKNYDEKGLAGELHTILPSKLMGLVNRKEMESVYNYRMVKKPEGRKIYDKLLSVPFERCPLCNQRRISTMDHYLPISKFPVFAITPVNLIPACFECNKLKLAKTSDKLDETTLHPYYDNIEDDVWLCASLVEEIPTVIEYKINPSFHWNAQLASRLQYHFDTYQLASLYGSHAAEEILNIKKGFKLVYQSGGPKEVQAELIKAYSTREAVNKNSWQTVLYRTLAASTWYHHSFR